MKKITACIVLIVLGVSLLISLVLGYRILGSSFLKAVKSDKTATIYEKVDNTILSIERGWNESVFFRSIAIDIYGYLQAYMGKQIIIDKDKSKTVLLGSDNKLYYAGNVTGSDNDSVMCENIQRLSEIQKYCRDHEIAFLYAIAPDKYNSQQVKLPVNVKDYMQQTIHFSTKITEHGVCCLNFQDLLNKQYTNYSDGFFPTDHHWNIKAAFWAYKHIIHKLANTYKINFDKRLLCDDKYATTNGTTDYLGSMGVRTGRYFAGSDTINIISPKWNTDFDVEFYTKTLNTKVRRSGSFDKALIDYQNPGYNMFITSDNSLVHVSNHLNKSGLRMLYIKDSFGIPLAPWLACSCDELWMLDLRYKQEMSVMRYIEDKKINCVIILYNPGMLGTDFLFDFNNVSSGK